MDSPMQLTMREVVDVIDTMKNNQINNYIVPGLDSFLLNKADCKVRLFQMTRPQEFYVAPHNHRFDFACCVIRGSVKHHVYRNIGDRFNKPQEITGHHVALYQVHEYVVDVDPRYGPRGDEPKKVVAKQYQVFERQSTVYRTGDWYTLKRDVFHSIDFSMGAMVLFLEGPDQQASSEFLEPVVNGKTIPLFTVPGWMYTP